MLPWTSPQTPQLVQLVILPVLHLRFPLVHLRFVVVLRSCIRLRVLQTLVLVVDLCELTLTEKSQEVQRGA